ncbi:MAG: hypothetical protein V1900_04730 [Candidatus Aenigmatarchaeota archaeon]
MFEFELGNKEKPKGHAIIYWQESGKYYMTYFALSPTGRLIGDYISKPCFIQSPVPVVDFENLKTTAKLRGDDMLRLLSFSQHYMTESLLDYTEKYMAYVSTSGRESIKIDIDELLLSVSSEKERLHHLTGLVGRMSDAVNTGEKKFVEQCESAVLNMSNYLDTSKYRLNEIAEAVKMNGDAGKELTRLYLERCFMICNERYEEIRKIDEAIEKLR